MWISHNQIHLSYKEIIVKIYRPPQIIRPFNFKLGFGLPLIAMLLLLIIDPTKLDFALARWMYQPGKGFVGRDSWFLEVVLHDQAKQVLIGFAACVFTALVASNWVSRLRPWRRSLGYFMLAATLSVGIAPALKKITEVHCPWSLTNFGGDEQYSSLLSPRPVTVNPGRCWPGGHATGGFSFFALFFVLRDYRPRLARTALLFAISLGIVFAMGRMLQGAHFLSHNLWTALLDWLICLGLYRAILYHADPVVSTAVISRLPCSLKYGKAGILKLAEVDDP